MSYHTGTSTPSNTPSNTSASPRVAPNGYHYMPDGSLMADSAMAQAQAQAPMAQAPVVAPVAIPVPTPQARVAQVAQGRTRQRELAQLQAMQGQVSFTANTNTLQPAVTDSNVKFTTNIDNYIPQDQAPEGFHYMANGVLMANSDHPLIDVGVDVTKQITGIDLDLSSIEWTGETRVFTVKGAAGSFQMQVVNAAGQYYDFNTNLFQAAQAKFNGHIVEGVSRGSIVFPTVTGDDQYNIFIYALPGTSHVAYNEVRFGDDSIDVNSSTGSNSLMLQKVIYQFEELTLQLSFNNAVGSSVTVAGSSGTSSIVSNRNAYKAKTPFSFTFTASNGGGLRFLRQPTSNDALAFVEPVLGNPITLQGENIHPAVTATGKINVAVDNSTTVTVDGLSATPKVGDKFFITDGTNLSDLESQVVTAVGEGSITSATAVTIANDKSISFSNQVNYSWPINNFTNLIEKDMVFLGSALNTGVKVKSYEDSVQVFQGTKQEKKIIKNFQVAIKPTAPPTIVKGLVTVQAGQISFDTQLLLASAGTTVKIGGYGIGAISTLSGWEVRFTDLSVVLSTTTTTTTEATSAHATIAVSDKEGVINNFSTVSGIGINPLLPNPIITSGGGSDGGGDWVMNGVQTLESGTALTVNNTGKVATLTGNIEIIRAGTASKSLFFDINEILSATAPS